MALAFDVWDLIRDRHEYERAADASVAVGLACALGAAVAFGAMDGKSLLSLCCQSDSTFASCNRLEHSAFTTHLINAFGDVTRAKALYTGAGNAGLKARSSTECAKAH